MNILFISHENALNGANKSMLNLIDAMSDRHKFFVWCRQGDKGELVVELKKRNVPIYCEPFYCWCTYKPRGSVGLLRRKLRWLLKERKKNVEAAREIAPFLKNNKINLIHMNSGVIDIGVQLKRLYKIPLVWHIREFGKEDFGWIPLCSSKQYYYEIGNYADKVVLISKALEKKYQDQLPKDKIRVIYNGVPTEAQVLDKVYDCDGRNIVFLQTGVLSEAKGQNIAVKALKVLTDAGYKDVKLIFAGRGNPEDVCTIEDIKMLNIEFLGQVNNMSEVRKRADVELVCSRCEAFGRVTVEAMMSGLPVIGSNSGGTPELIENGTTGFVFKPNDPSDLAEKMKMFIDNVSLIELMGRNASQYARKRFNITLCAMRMNQVYEEVTNTFYGLH